MRVVLMVLIPLGILLLLAALLLPSISRPSKPAGPRDHSESNLHQIGQAILLYSTDNNGAYPDSFRTILLNEDTASDVFVSPLSNDTPAQGPSKQAIADQLGAGGHVSYVYLGNQLTTNNVTPDTVVAYEKLEPGANGTDVLYADGNVKWVDSDTASKIIAEAQAGKFPVTMPAN